MKTFDEISGNERMMSRIATCGLLLGSLVSVLGGCTQLVSSHCANNEGDQSCREGGRGMYCSQCTLANDGCVDEMPADASCLAGGGAAGSSSGGPSSATESTGPDGTTLGPDETTEGPIDSTDSGGIPSCVDQGNTCIEAAPADFDGPVTIIVEPEARPDSNCPGSWSQEGLERYGDVIGSPASCPCDCGPVLNGVCGNAEVTRYSLSGCGILSVTESIVAGCNDFPGTWTVLSGSFYFTAPTLTAGSCNPESSVETDQAGLATRYQMCESPALSQSTCAEGEVCAPPSEEGLQPQYCVWQEGTHACPSGSIYTERTLVYESFTDERGCEACECTLPTESCVGTTASLAVAADCMGSSAGTLSADACVDAIGVGPAAEAISHNPGSPPPVDCTPNTPGPTGEVVPTGPVTLCCTR